VRVEGETDELRRRARAIVESVSELESSPTASLPNAFLLRKGVTGPWRRARVTISFPVANLGANLPTLAATVSGNLYDLGELTGLRLESMELPVAYRAKFEFPRAGVSGTRAATGVQTGPLVGTIIKPNVGFSPEQTAELVGRLCAAGVDIIKDDEVCANPDHAPLAGRVKAVMSVVRAHAAKTGRHVMFVFNVSDEMDAMRRHVDLVQAEGGSCVMVSLNWCGLSAVQTLRRHTALAIHGHRNGYGALSRHPLLGVSFHAYQTMWRLAGIDHLHVHGMQGKFSQTDEEVIESARACLTPLDPRRDDRILPVLSSGQWAGTVPATWDAIKSDDVCFMSGGGILAHPDGPAAGVTSIRQAWDAARAGFPLSQYAGKASELARALTFFGER
jgi:ribulose-bisphosphate carboxylase large chain